MQERPLTEVVVQEVHPWDSADGGDPVGDDVVVRVYAGGGDAGPR